MEDRQPSSAGTAWGKTTVRSLMDACDWSASPLGRPEVWPSALRSVNGLMLGSKFPMFLAWGPELGLLYNDAYAEILGAKHPAALGRRMNEVWHEIWTDIAPMIDAALCNQAVFYENLSLTLHRQGYEEQAWFTFSYSPVHDDDGAIAGVFCTVVETTSHILTESALRTSEARLRFLDELSAATGPLNSADAILATTTRMLGEHLGLSVCAYADMDEDQDGFTIRGDWAAPGSTGIVGHYSLAAFGRRAVQNLGHGQPLIVNDTQRELLPEEAATFQSIGIAATICMPLVKNGRLTALMAIHDREPRVWTDEELGLMREVTDRSWAHIERVSAVADLRASEAALRRLNADLERQVIERTLARGRTWQISPDLMGALSLQGDIETFNPAWTKTLGWSEAEVEGKSIWEMLHPDDVEPTRDAFVLTQTGQPVIQFANRCQCKDGGYRWISWVGVPEDGLVYCTGRDVTAERERDAELAARTAERDQLWNLSADMLARADYGGMMLSVSPAWSRVLGFTDAELLSRPYSDFMHPDDAPPTLAALARMGETGASVRFENRILTSTGDYKPIGWTVVPDPNDMSFIAVGRDFTEAKAHEKELEQAQTALRQSQKLEALGQLTGGVAHDFNNLLTAVMSNLELLSKRLAGDARTTRLIEGAMQGAQRGATLTQRMLAFARRQDLKIEPRSLTRLVESAEDLLRQSVGDSFELRLDLARQVPLALVDDNQFDLALLNLVLNARDAMPEGGIITVTVDHRLPQDDPQGSSHGYVCLTVADRGQGMDKETLEKATQPFFSTKGIGKGSGLGLSMIHGLALQLNGKLHLESQVGQGTVAELWLPATDVADRQNDLLVAEPASGPDHRSLRILTVDDDALISMSSVDMLEDLGHVVTSAYSGAKALEILHAEPAFDLLITDFSMPRMNGGQLATAARQLFPELPILLATGYAELPGDDDLRLPKLAKPYQQHQLQAAIESVMRR